MLVLSRTIGQHVRAADGGVVGRLRDVTARLRDEDPVVARLAVGSRRRLTHLVPWSAVASFERADVRYLATIVVIALCVGARRC